MWPRPPDSIWLGTIGVLNEDLIAIPKELVYHYIYVQGTAILGLHRLGYISPVHLSCMGTGVPYFGSISITCPFLDTLML